MGRGQRIEVLCQRKSFFVPSGVVVPIAAFLSGPRHVQLQALWTSDAYDEAPRRQRRELCEKVGPHFREVHRSHGNARSVAFGDRYRPDCACEDATARSAATEVNISTASDIELTRFVPLLLGRLSVLQKDQAGDR